MKLLLIREQGRAARRRAGGIYRSGVEIYRVLTSLGWEVVTHRDKSPLPEIPEGTDVVWHYGDYRHVDDAVAAAIEADVPIVVTSSFTNRGDSAKLLSAWWEGWGRDPRIFFSTWSSLALFDPRLQEISSQLVMLPKTLRLGGKSVPLRGRSGFALGDLTKLQMPKVMGGLRLEEVCVRLREEWPEEPLFCFEQHTPLGPPPEEVTLVPYQQDLLKWLGRRKLLISLVVGETFAMVPMEAQHVGTPVLYRHQPQSLSQTVGQSGVLFRDLDELVGAARILLEPVTWSAYSKAGKSNYLGHQHYGVGMDLGLREVVRRARS